MTKPQEKITILERQLQYLTQFFSKEGSTLQLYDVIIIGAGPAGCHAASILLNSGLSVAIVEKLEFPRFSLGESFLPQNMVFFQKSGLDQILDKGDFKLKDGAVFFSGEKVQSISFQDKLSFGPSKTYQVDRSDFDFKSANFLSAAGVHFFFNTKVTSVDFSHKGNPFVFIQNIKDFSQESLNARFVVDSSGFGSVLSQQLNIPMIRSDSLKTAYYSHIQTSAECSFDNNKILIVSDINDSSTWFWLIPLSQKKYSIGLITDKSQTHKTEEEVIRFYIDSNPYFKSTIGKFNFSFPCKKIQKYSQKPEKAFGEDYVFIGNAGGFLDPIFSSGVTIALKTADVASELIIKKLQGEKIDWQKSYIDVVSPGIDVFKSFVNSWYRGELQKIIFGSKNSEIYKMVVSILAGYAWDLDNPMTKRTSQRLKAMADLEQS